MKDIRITGFEIKDIRFPTSRFLHGSDAMNPDPDYSAAYVILETNVEGLEGHGLTFTIGRGNEICAKAIRSLAPLVVGKQLKIITNDFGEFWNQLAGDSQLRWLGPEKGVIHLATGAIINAVWDLYAKAEEKPLWRLLVDLSPEDLVNCIDFSYITDVITPEEAISILSKKEATKQQRMINLLDKGYPAYNTSMGWLGYSDDKIRQLCQKAKKEGWKSVKMKVGADIKDDIRRAGIIRDEMGYDIKLMMDANQKWEIEEAIASIKKLERFEPWWIEEPTSPDDILGHAAISKAVRPTRVATGEHCQNRIMFKQFIKMDAIDVCQIDSCRVGGVNEVLAILLIAAKYEIPVCPHAGGVGLCEYVQHLSMADYIAISGSMDNRIIEYVDHLHEHFLDPVRIKKGHYLPPERPGYSIEMKKNTLQEYAFPDGKVWQKMPDKD